MGRKSNIESQLNRVVHLVIKEDSVTTSFIQRKLSITYPSAQLVLKKLAELDYIEEYKPFKKLKVNKRHLIQ